jgi:actin-related protein 3
MKQYNSITGTDESIDCNVFQNIVQRYAVWFGGSVLGAHDNFSKICKSREDYAEYGPSICRHNALFNS